MAFHKVWLPLIRVKWVKCPSEWTEVSLTCFVRLFVALSCSVSLSRALILVVTGKAKLETDIVS